MKNYSFIEDRIVFIVDRRKDSVINDIFKRHDDSMSHLGRFNVLRNEMIPEWLLVCAPYDKRYLDDIIHVMDICDEAFTILYDAGYLEFKTYFQLFMKNAQIIRKEQVL